jgi:hypothetical protein
MYEFRFRAIVRTTDDDTMYALVQCEEGNLKYEYLAKHFVKKIKLGPKDQLYIIPITSIVGPLLCIPNILSEGVVSEDQFLVTMAYHKWGKYFIHFCEKIHEKYGENDLSEEEVIASDKELGEEFTKEDSDDEDSDEDSDEETDEFEDDLDKDYW